MPTWPTKLYVDKQPPAFSSALVAWGLARLLHDMLEQLDLKTLVNLSDQGTCFCIATSANFDISGVSFVRLLRQIRTARQTTGLASDAYDYEQVRQRERDYFAALRIFVRKEHLSLNFLN